MTPINPVTVHTLQSYDSGIDSVLNAVLLSPCDLFISWLEVSTS